MSVTVDLSFDEPVDVVATKTKGGRFAVAIIGPQRLASDITGSEAQELVNLLESLEGAARLLAQHLQERAATIEASP